MHNHKAFSLQDFLSTPYPIILSEKDKKFIIYVPKLQIYVEENSLDLAYEKYNKEKQSFYTRLEKIEALHLIPALNAESKILNRIEFKKVLIERFTSFIFTAIFWLLLLSVVIHQIGKGTNKVGEAFVPVEPAKQAERMQKFREKMDVLAPYIHEVKRVFNE